MAKPGHNRRCFSAAATVALCCVIGSHASYGETFALRDALSSAYISNPQLNAGRAKLQATDEEVAKANSGWRPTIGLSGTYGMQNRQTNPVSAAVNGDIQPTIGQVSITEPLFRGGRTLAGIGRAKALVSAGREELLQTEADVFLAAITAYMDVVRDRAIFSFRQQNLDLLSDQLKSVAELRRSRAVTSTDFSQTEARVARARSGAAIARGQLMASEAQFEQIIGRPPATLDGSPPLPKLPESSEAALATSLDHPLVLRARENESAARFAANGAEDALLPEASLQLQYQHARDDLTSINARAKQDSASVMFQVRIPVYQGGAEYAAIRQAKDVQAQQHFASIAAEQQVRQQIQQAWSGLEAAQLFVISAVAQQSASAAARGGVAEEQRGGERSILDVLNATQELVDAQIAVSTAEHDRTVAAYQLLAATGRLSARYLKLPVEYYDPTSHYDENASSWFGLGN